MPTFPSRPLKPESSLLSRLTPLIRRRPVIFFGLPFLLTIVGASFGLSHLTQTRYDYNATKVQSISKQQELNMKKDRKRVDIREEYFKLQAKADELDEWEPRRIERPTGTPVWGLPPPVRAEELEGEHRERESSFHWPKGKRQVVLGKDGRPCKACNEKSAFGAALKGAKKVPMQCPPDVAGLGRATWTFLHSAAAYYPEQPNQKQQQSMLALLKALPDLYPCHNCAHALGEEYAREVKEQKGWEEKDLLLTKAIATGPGLRKWLCGIHNEVNERLGKPTFPCTAVRLTQRWKDGPADGSCD